MTTNETPDSLEKYVSEIVKTALHNGMTIQEIAQADPDDLAKAHLQAHNNSMDKMCEEIAQMSDEEFSNNLQIFSKMA